jgi:phosphoglycolate phosphatase-like HAD superfamily hydrolase
MNRAFDDLFGIAGAFDGIEMAGRTDKWILDAAAARAGIEMAGDNFERFRHRYFARLVEALPAHGGSVSHGAPAAHSAPVTQVVSPADALRHGPSGVLPGVRELLAAIGARADCFPALLTGNCEQGARIKLEHFDLWKFFRCGAYGDEVADRNHLVDVALQRAAACGAPEVRRDDVVVVGDTVLDVACAKAAGARCVAVATGTADAGTLTCAGADLVMSDLSDTSAFLRFVLRTDLKYNDAVGADADEAGGSGAGWRRPGEA